MTLRTYHFYVASSKESRYPYLVIRDDEEEDTPLEEYTYKVSKEASNWYEAHYYLFNIFIKNESYSAPIPHEESDISLFLKSFNWELYTGFPIEGSYTSGMKYRYLIGSKGYKILKVVLEGDSVVITAEDSYGDEVTLSSEDFYGHGSSLQDALENAGSYLRGRS